MSITLRGKDPTTGQNKLFGTLTAWTPFVPTGSWVANTTYVGFYRQIGDTLEVRVGISLTGAPNSTNLTVQLPSGFNIDASKITNVTLKTPIGQGSTSLVNVATDPLNSFLVVTADPDSSLDTVEVYAPEETGTSPFLSISDPTAVTELNPDIWGSGDSLELKYSVPVIIL